MPRSASRRKRKNGARGLAGAVRRNVHERRGGRRPDGSRLDAVGGVQGQPPVAAGALPSDQFSAAAIRVAFVAHASACCGELQFVVFRLSPTAPPSPTHPTSAHARADAKASSSPPRCIARTTL